MIGRFRKKPVVIEAMQLANCRATAEQIIRWAALFGVEVHLEQEDRHHLQLRTPTLEGDHIASVGDWIIKGVKNGFYPCKPEIFAMTYEREPQHSSGDYESFGAMRAASYDS